MSKRMKGCVLTMFLAVAPAWPAGQAAASGSSEEIKVLARISYTSTYVSDANEKRSPEICFEVYQNGRYKMRKMQKGGMVRLGGDLSAEELLQMKGLLKKLDFKSSEGGMVQRGTESFVAEIVGKEDSERYIWMNPDHQRPFPESVAKLILWLQEFDDRRAAPFADPELSTDPICPRASAKPVEPVRPK